MHRAPDTLPVHLAPPARRRRRRPPRDGSEFFCATRAMRCASLAMHPRPSRPWPAPGRHQQRARAPCAARSPQEDQHTQKLRCRCVSLLSAAFAHPSPWQRSLPLLVLLLGATAACWRRTLAPRTSMLLL